MNKVFFLSFSVPFLAHSRFVSVFTITVNTETDQNGPRNGPKQTETDLEMDQNGPRNGPKRT